MSGSSRTPRVNSNTSYSFVTFHNRGTGEHVYDVHIVNMRNTYQFSPRFFIRAVVQFDSSRERVLGDFLASYELSPGTVVHAGYGSLYGRVDESCTSIDIERTRARSSSRRPTARTSDRGHQPPRTRTVTAIRMQQRWVVEGTQRGHMYLRRRHARARQLVSRGAPQVEPRPGVVRKPARRLGMRREVSGEIRADFIAARADAGAHGGDHVGRLRVEALCERANRHDHGARRRAPPSGMHRRHCAAVTIGQQDRNTVGGPHAEHHGRIVADGDIAFRPRVVSG